MRKLLTTLVMLGSLSLAATDALAGVHNHNHGPVPDSHGPASIMGDHLHTAEGIMTGYRYSRSSYSDLYAGNLEVDNASVAMAGYSMLPTSMTMEMVMLDIMYAFTDDLTFMLMPQYMSMDMHMTGTTEMDMEMNTDMGMSTDMGMDAGMGMSMDMTGAHMQHKVSGMGDTKASALYRLASGESFNLIGSLGVSIPTGDVDRKNADGSYVHYSMQLGSGTWDLAPALTLSGNAGRLGYGAKVCATVRLQDENDAGYALGDVYKAEAWSSLRVLDWLSVSVRAAYQNQDPITGAYDELYNTTSPMDNPANYGGEFLDVGVGVNTVFTAGNAKGLRLGLEWVTRTQEDYNGYQLGLDDSLVASISYSFK